MGLERSRNKTNKSNKTKLKCSEQYINKYEWEYESEYEYKRVHKLFIKVS